MIERRISFETRADLDRALSYIERQAPTEIGAGAYIVEVDLETYLTPKQQVAVAVNRAELRMSFFGRSEEAVEALAMDCLSKDGVSATL